MKKTKYLTENWAMMEENGKIYMAEVIIHNEQGKARFEFKPISKRYDEIRDPDGNGIAIVRDGEYYGLIDKKGKEICKPQHMRIRGFYSEWYSTYNVDGKMVSIDKNGEVRWI